MKRFEVLMFIAFFLLLISCNNNDLKFDDLKTLKIGEFQLQVPSNLNLIEEQGYDSYVGKIEGSGLAINYDYGMYTSPIQNFSEEDFTLIRDTINGLSRQLLIANKPQKDYTSIHISRISSNSSENNFGSSLKMYSSNLSDKQQKLTIKIFESVTIVEP